MPVKLISLFFINNKLQIINIELEEKNFSQVIDALKEKYGQPKYKEEVIQNRMGASFENKIYTWSKQGNTLEATRYSRKIDISSIPYRADAVVDNYTKRRDSISKERAKDL